jgi:hypothetical protein
MTIQFFNRDENCERKEEILKLYEQMGIKLEEPKEPELKLEPQLEPLYLNFQMLNEYTPEKIELDGGVLYFGEPWISRMFLLHLYHIDLNEAVKFAPKEMWLKALENLNQECPSNDTDGTQD